MRSKKSFLFLLAIAALLPFTIQWIKPYLEERLPDTFSLDRIAIDLQGDLPHFAMPDLPIFAAQEFHYLGHGGQAVAFASADGKYVLKFFLTKQLHGEKRFPIPKPTHWIPAHRKARQEQREQARQRSLMKAMRNYCIAFEKIPEKTGIIGLHLVAADENLPVVILLDQNGRRHPVDLNRASFVFQHKAQLVKDKLASASTVDEKQRVLAALNKFFEERARAGFVDVERSFMIEMNYGFLGEIPIQLDVGNIEFLEPLQSSPEEEIGRIQGLLRNWAMGV